MYPHLTPGYTIRPPTREDIPAIIDLLHAVDLAEAGETDVYTPDSILRDWEELNLDTDAWLVLAPDGMLCGYGTLSDDDAGRLLSDGYVHPAQYGRGIGTTLLEAMETRAAAMAATQPAGIRLVLVNQIVADNSAARNLVEARGYALTRVFFRMSILMETPPPPPVWPAGMTVRACDGSPEEIRRVYETAEESFQDHWAHAPRSFEDWRRHQVRESFDPSLWFLASEGDELVGVTLGYTLDAESGWINTVGVRRPWRKRGLGMALLQHAFGAFYQRAIPRVGLGVDGQSLTGAERLYERAGMHVTMRIGRYEKELRSGRDVLAEL